MLRMTPPQKELSLIVSLIIKFPNDPIHLILSDTFLKSNYRLQVDKGVFNALIDS